MQAFRIQRSNIHGNGLFAVHQIARGETIFTVTGPIIRYPFEPDYRNGGNWLQIRKNIWRMPLRNNPWHFINHSCRPNAGISGTSTVVAARKIKAGEEISLDYSTVEAGRAWRMPCRCGAPICRETIRGIQFLPRQIFLEREPWIPKHLRPLYFAEKTYPITVDGLKKLMAKHPIKDGEALFTVEGPEIHYTFPPNYHIGYQWLAVGKNRWIISLKNNPWGSIRHSCEPNTIVDRRRKVVALRAIAPDEEVTVDDTTTEADPNWKHICHCGATTCRGTVRSIQFLDDRRYRRYERYLSAFFKRAYLLRRKSNLRSE
ncbi:TPA: hypothetical protein DDZ10_04715 [Candidatus Uhrbacteria bacterium]|uniref:Nuclear protein SET n=1 Tax=Candidatus Uhrbacteria bacterium GW2011_GWC2_53_7 TaxID=1618986 RepID=A0A0G1Y1J0_9BACT|nr:MAG: Nuclear protein SET [Candidatus Uhrbacteria bacterium GW2011_GWC2_53_7]HBL39935.1 hypothetical protein [Candidatus Uhrbacteria bacterium]